MKFRYAALFLLAGCTSVAPRNVESRWLLLAAPATSEYRSGCDLAPITQWSRVGEYPSSADCESSSWEAYNELQVPMQCASNDDPRLKGARLLSIASADCHGESCLGGIRQPEASLAAR
jgi:hypothetical protein